MKYHFLEVEQYNGGTKAYNCFIEQSGRFFKALDKN